MLFIYSDNVIFRLLDICNDEFLYTKLIIGFIHFSFFTLIFDIKLLAISYLLLIYYSAYNKHGNINCDLA